ncbi:helix-turn-helix domain-containing protein [Aeromicrobium alkaliterrae]
MLTVAEVARWLSVSDQTVRKLASDDQIPHVRLTGRALRFDREQLQEWIDQRTRGADRGPRVPEPRGELVDED